MYIYHRQFISHGGVFDEIELLMGCPSSTPVDAG